jgi:hypothetical protein
MEKVLSRCELLDFFEGICQELKIVLVVTLQGETKSVLRCVLTKVETSNLAHVLDLAQVFLKHTLPESNESA